MKSIKHKTTVALAMYHSTICEYRFCYLKNWDRKQIAIENRFGQSKITIYIDEILNAFGRDVLERLLERDDGAIFIVPSDKNILNKQK